MVIKNIDKLTISEILLKSIDPLNTFKKEASEKELNRIKEKTKTMKSRGERDLRTLYNILKDNLLKKQELEEKKFYKKSDYLRYIVRRRSTFPPHMEHIIRKNHKIVYKNIKEIRNNSKNIHLNTRDIDATLFYNKKCRKKGPCFIVQRLKTNQSIAEKIARLLDKGMTLKKETLVDKYCRRRGIGDRAEKERIYDMSKEELILHYAMVYDVFGTTMVTLEMEWLNKIKDIILGKQLKLKIRKGSYDNYYRTSKKGRDYRAIHMDVLPMYSNQNNWIELKLMTITDFLISEFGDAAHDLYKHREKGKTRFYYENFGKLLEYTNLLF